MKVKLKLLLVSGLFVAGIAARGQSASEKVSQALQVRAGTEQLYVQTDKKVYIAGDVIWFKAWAVNNLNRKPATHIKVLYVDVLDRENRSIVQGKIALDNGSGSGALDIPVIAATGNFRFRAYTNSMKNIGPDVFFEKELTIINPQIAPATIAKTESDYDLRFFPEGGTLVEGFANRVAFKATGSDGKGKDIRGSVIDQKGDTVARFNSAFAGIGSFIFTPRSAEAYRAVIRSSGNSIRVTDLPAVSGNGFSMLVSDKQDALDVKVGKGGNAAETIYLVVHDGKKVSHALQATLNAGTASLTVAKQQLSDGISYLTVFNSQLQPVSERLYFKRPAQKLNLTANTGNTDFGSRQLVNVKLAAGAPVATDLAVSVYRIDSLQQVDEAEIFSHLWLEGVLKGHIEQPGYYLNNQNGAANAALDNLMLTQGWRQFSLGRYASDLNLGGKYLSEVNGHLITGKIKDPNGEPVAGALAYMGIPGKRIQYYAARSDKDGRFIFNTRDLFGHNEIVVQTNYLKDTTSVITIEMPFSEQYSTQKMQPFNYDARMGGAVSSQNIGRQVSSVFGGIRQRQYFIPTVDSTAFFAPGKLYVLDDYVRFPTIEEIIREYVTNVNVSKRNRKFHLRVGEGVDFMENAPLVLLDGVPYFDIDKVVGMDPLKIERLEVVKERFYYGPSVEDGILSFQTPKGDLGGIPVDPRAVILDYEGLQLRREFYQPVYDNESRIQSRLPDFRNTLYWSPEIGTDASGNGAFKFYTSDQKGTFIGVVQGMSADGVAGSAQFRFDVK